MPVLNIAGYKFVPLEDLDSLQEQFTEICQNMNIKGTVLLSEEGINQFVAGDSAQIEAYLALLEKDPRFAGISYRRSYTEDSPFKKLRVKIKPEIITLRDNSVEVDMAQRKSISPEEFNRWIREGKKMTILDTRNEFEVKLGTFENAEELNLTFFSEFPEAIKSIDEEKKHLPMVTFCTGGVRCEKAAPALENEGFQEVYQLEGGILNYFEKCGGEFYKGECFVFDDRITVNGDLQQTGTLLCSFCQDAFEDPEPVRDLRPAERLCERCSIEKKAA